MDTVVQLEIDADMRIDEMVVRMERCGFGARRLAEAVSIYEQMLASDYQKFLTLSGAMVPAGMRNIVSDLIRRRYVDVLVTTGANLVHDIIESFSPHRLGSCQAEDESLRKEGLSRIYDVYLSDEQFTDFEEMMQAILPQGDGTITGTALIRYLGSKIDDRRSILRSAYEMDIPIFCPALADSMIGLQAWIFSQTHRLKLDALADVREIVDLCYGAKRAGILIVGGGVPKNFALQSMLVTPKSFHLAVQLTTDHPEGGGLSGATLSEAVSWGKISPTARTVTVYGDATITLPLLVASVLTRLKGKQP